MEYLAILYGLDDVSEELKTKRYQQSSQSPPQVDAWVELMKEADDDALDKIALSLAESLREDARALESIALKTVAHGFVVEERFTSIEGDDRPAMEFKIFCFWGRVWGKFLFILRWFMSLYSFYSD